MPLSPLNFAGALGRQIVELHMWVVREGIRGADAAAIFDGLCQRLVSAGVPLWRAFIGMPTLHPQWGGYSYTWRRDLNAIEPAQFGRGDEYEQILQNSPFGYLIRQVEISPPDGAPWQHLRRRLAGPEALLDFSILKDLAAAGASDYLAQVVRFGADGDASHGTGIGYSFASDLPDGFRDDDLVLLQAVLPAVSLAMMTHGGHMIASGLLKAYLGGDAGTRVHAGAVERGSVESIRAVLREAMAQDNGPGAILDVADLAAPSVVEACLARTTHTISVAGIDFVVSGADAPRGARLREIFGDLAPVAVIHGENSDKSGEVVACPGRDYQVSEGDWTAMIGTADELADQGIAIPGPLSHSRARRPPRAPGDRRGAG